MAKCASPATRSAMELNAPPQPRSVRLARNASHAKVRPITGAGLTAMARTAIALPPVLAPDASMTGKLGASDRLAASRADAVRHAVPRPGPGPRESAFVIVLRPRATRAARRQRQGMPQMLRTTRATGRPAAARSGATSHRRRAPCRSGAPASAAADSSLRLPHTVAGRIYFA